MYVKEPNILDSTHPDSTGGNIAIQDNKTRVANKQGAVCGGTETFRDGTEMSGDPKAQF